MQKKEPEKRGQQKSEVWSFYTGKGWLMLPVFLPLNLASGLFRYI
jgi:hypothetical protein